MREEDIKMMTQVKEILEKELKAEAKKVVDAGQFAPGQTKTLSDAVCLMLKMNEYEEWLNGEGMSEYSQRNYARSYADPMNMRHGQYRSYGSYPGNYDFNYSGHSTKDRMISRLEDMMGDVKNEYEARMIRDAIVYIQSLNA